MEGMTSCRISGSQVRKENPSHVFTNQTTGECGLSGPGKDQVWPDLQPWLQNENDSITVELKNYQMIWTEVGFTALL